MAKKTTIIDIASQGAEKVQGELGDITKSISEMPKGLAKATSGIKRFTSSGIAGMKGLRAAIVATGIGGLLIAVTSVTSAFRRFQDLADLLSEKLAGVGAVVDVLADGFGLVGRAIVSAFTEPTKVINSLASAVEGVVGWFKDLGAFIQGTVIKQFLRLRATMLSATIAVKDFFGADTDELEKKLKDVRGEIEQIEKVTDGLGDRVSQPFIDAADAVGMYVNELNNAREAAEALERAEQSLRDTQISQIAGQAARNKEIAKSRLIAEDEARSYAERIRALEEATKLEEQNLQESLANAKEQARIIRERNQLSESSADDLREEAQANAAVYELETQSLQAQRRIFTELQTLKKQAAAEALERRKEENAGILEAQALSTTIEVEQAQASLQAVRQIEQDKIDIKRTSSDALEDLLNADIEGEQFYVESVSALTSLLGDESKRAFQVNKGVQIAETLISTYAAAQKAYNSQLTIPSPDAPVRAAVAAGVSIAQGLARVASIASVKFDGGGGGGASGGAAAGVSGGGSAQVLTPGNLVPDIPTADQTPIQTYVVEQNITDSQSLSTELRRRATL